MTLDQMTLEQFGEMAFKALAEEPAPPEELQGKPFPEEHAARIRSPNLYKRFRRQNNAFGSGVDVIYGVRKDNDKVEVQAIRFKTSKFTVAQARAWLKSHDYTATIFEPASGSSAASLTDPPSPDNDDATAIPFQEDSLETILSDQAARKNAPRADATKADNRECKDLSKMDAEKNAQRWLAPLGDSQLICGKAEDDDGIDVGSLEGYASTFDNVDLGGDVVRKGAFKKTISEHKNSPIPLMIRHFAYGGDILEAIGFVPGLKEDSHGLKFNAQYFADTASQAMRQKIAEMRKNSVNVSTSIGYRLMKSGQVTIDDKPANELLEVAVGEITVTLKPMNTEAVVTVAKTQEETPVTINLPAEQDALTGEASRVFELVGKDGAGRTVDAMVALTGLLRDLVAPKPQDTKPDAGSTGGEPAAATDEKVDLHSDADEVKVRQRAVVLMEAQLLSL